MRTPVLGLALLLVLGCAPRAKAPPGSGLASTAPPERARALVVIGVNDTHGALLPTAPPRGLERRTGPGFAGMAWFAGYVAAARADAAGRGAGVLVLDAGDELQGSLISNRFLGRPVIEAYGLIGVDAAALGNHEFDFGVAALRANAALAHYPFLAANLVEKASGRRPDWVQGGVLVDVRGVKVGIVGLATTETRHAADPRIVEGFDFLPGGPACAAEAARLRAAGATVILLTAHAGPLPPHREIQAIARTCRVDAIVSGHNHISLSDDTDLDGIPVLQSGSKLRAFSIVELELDEQGRVRSSRVNRDTLPHPGSPQALLHDWDGAPATFRGRTVRPDPRVEALLKPYEDQIRALRDSVVGETAVTLRKGGPDDLLSNLCAQALREAATPRAEVALQNAGGIRVRELAAGPLTYGQLFELSPFDDEVVVLHLTAEQLRDALETVLREGKGPLRVSGIRYAIARGDRRDRRNAPRGAIVTRVEGEDGQLLCAASCIDRTLSVATTDFLANGGDGLRFLRALEHRPTGVSAREALVGYVKAHRPLTGALLGEGRRRIDADSTAEDGE